MKKILAIASATLLLGSCGIYNKYERPDLNTKGLVRDTASLTDTLAVQDTVSFGNMPWRKVFTDPQLQSLIETALANNVDLLNAAQNVKIVQAQLTTAKLSYLPSLSFSPQGVLSSWDGATPTKTYQLPITASWNLDLFGSLTSAKRSAQAALIGMKDYQTMMKTNVICNVANMYYTLLMLDRQTEILLQMKDLTKETWDMMKLQMELGRARSTSVQSAESSYLGIQASLADMRRQTREVENSLSLLLGQPAGTIARGKMDQQSLPADLRTGLPIQMLNNRPDVHYAEMQLAQCFYDTENARSRFYPQINISATGSFTNSGGAGIVNPGKWLLNAVAGLTQPIFMKGQIVAGLKVAKAKQEQALNTWQNSVLKAGAEVSNALVQYNSADEKSRIEAQQVEVLRKNVEDTKQLYTSSGITYLEVIQAQSSLLNAETSKCQDDLEKMQAVVSLYNALGGGRD